MNAKEYKAATGREPEQDDLERANCKKHGVVWGHACCGVCPICGKPRTDCIHPRRKSPEEVEEELIARGYDLDELFDDNPYN